jgi:hypothetical protein
MRIQLDINKKQEISNYDQENIQVGDIVILNDDSKFFITVTRSSFYAMDLDNLITLYYENIDEFLDNGRFQIKRIIKNNDYHIKFDSIITFQKEYSEGDLCTGNILIMEDETRLLITDTDNWCSFDTVNLETLEFLQYDKLQDFLYADYNIKYAIKNDEYSISEKTIISRIKEILKF